MNELIKRLLTISFNKQLTHIGSCVSALPVIKEIYDTKKKDEPFILSAGHCFLAQAVVMEHKKLGDAEEIFDHHGVHPDRCKKCGIDYSSGSLGHGLGGALGMALANKNRNVYCMISDGECMEGSIWEALRMKSSFGVKNLIVYVNMNGYSALGEINKTILSHRLKAFCPDIQIRETDFAGIDFLQGVSAHYIHLENNEKVFF